MLIILSLLTAVLAYILIDMGLNIALAQRINTEERIKETRNIMSQDDFGFEDENASITNRLMKPLYNRFLDIFLLLVTRDPKQLKKTEDQLAQAGIRMSARDYRASVIMSIVIFTFLGFFLQLILKQPMQKCLLGAGVGLYAGYTITRFSITGKIKRRKTQVYHDLPEMMDLLNVSVSAGLGFDQAIAYIVKKSKGPLFDELKITQREIALGRTRKEALNRFAERCDNMEIQTFVTAVVQADEMGSSLKNVLQVQADTIRETHKQNVEEKAQKLSVKILIPMIMFIFPVMFIVLMGPAAISVIDAFSGGGI